MNQRLAVMLADIFGMRVSDIRLELHKDDVGTWDSLKQMDLVMTLEREYDIAFEIPEILKMVSVDDIVQVLEKKGVNLGD